jgi:hypothetical protein
MKRILLLATLFSATSFIARAQNDKDLVSAKFSDQPQSKASLKKVVVRLYPNPSFGKLSVSANTDNTLHFYIFDLEGTLVYQAVLSNKQSKSIEDLKKGTYLYDVFEKDESIEEGKIIIK